MSSVQDILMRLNRRGASRRTFMRSIGLSSVGFAGMAALAGCGGGGTAGLASIAPVNAAASSGTITDADILNFALNLEYLEAEFYTMATTGKNLAQSGFALNGTGASGDTTGGNEVMFIDAEHQNIAVNIASDEQQHVLLLRQALGSAAVAKPAINLAALGLGFGSQQEFLTLARAFEDTGVTAYAGAAPLISSKQYLAVAARILATEAEHSGNIRLQAVQLEVDGGKIGALDSLDIPPTDGVYFSVTYQGGLVETRTPQQVLAIVYHGTGLKAGGFFPNGVNGNIASS